MNSTYPIHPHRPASVVRRVGRALAAVALGLMLAGAVSTARAGGHVLPPGAKVHGYSLDDMASAVANFSISGNDPAYYPVTPFQILYRLSSQQDPTGANTFTVRPGTFLYLKFFFIDDAAPAIGNWPANKDGVADYVFGRNQLGAHDLEVEVDGKIFSLDDAGYVGGPVPTPNSPDGSEHLLQIGAFVSPLPRGAHRITIRGIFDGDAFVNVVGGPFAASITYTVIVR